MFGIALIIVPWEIVAGEVGSDLRAPLVGSKHSQKRSETLGNGHQCGYYPETPIETLNTLSECGECGCFCCVVFRGCVEASQKHARLEWSQAAAPAPGAQRIYLNLVFAKFSFLFDKNSPFLKFCLKSCPYGLVSRKVAEGVDPWWWQTLRVATRQHTCEAHEHLTVQTLDNRS